MRKIPLTVITGYLGAGKTTLLLRLLKHAQENKIKLAVLMNEFGEVSVDGRIVKGKNVELVELAGGCVCCSMSGELEAAVKEVLKLAKPDHIVLETTGVAEPDAIIVDAQNLRGIALDSIITVVDADALSRFPQVGHTGRVQIEMADLLLLNKTDLAGEKELAQIEKRLKQLNSRAAIMRTKHGAADPRILLGINAQRPHGPLVPHGHGAGAVDSFVLSREKPLSEKALLQFAGKIPREVYRAKGFVKLVGGGTALFNYVAGRAGIGEWSGSEETRVVFIGEGAKKSEGKLRKEWEKL